MTDAKTPDGEKTLHAAGAPKTLSVKRPDSGVVRQAFSHGRSKAVVVEKKRTPTRPGRRNRERVESALLQSDGGGEVGIQPSLSSSAGQGLGKRGRIEKPPQAAREVLCRRAIAIKSASALAKRLPSTWR